MGVFVAVALVVAGAAAALLAPGVTAQEEPPSCAARDHEEPTRSEGDVETAQTSDGWRASQQVVIEGDTGGAQAASVGLSTFGGSVDVRTTEGTDLGPREYRVTADLEGRGDTRQAARDALAEVSVDHADDLDDEVLQLETEATRDGQGHSAGASLTVHVPRGPLYELDVDVGGGSVDVRGPFPRVAADVGGGDVTLRVIPWATGAIHAETGGGDIDILLRGTGDNGYDVRAEVGGGSIELTIPDARPVGGQEDDRRHVRTADFGDRSPTTDVTADVGGGSIVVEANQEGEGSGPFCVDASSTAEGEAWGPGQLHAGDAGVSTAGVLLAGGTVVAGLAGLWLAFRERIAAFFLALYSRLTRREVVEHEARQQILEAVDEEPGIHFRALSRRLDLGHGVLEHHLDKLAEADLLETHETGSHVLYFRTGAVGEERRRAIAATKAPGTRRVLRAVAESSEPTISEIAEEADLALSTVSHHVQRLEAEGILDVRREGGAKRVGLTELGEALAGRAPEP